MRKVELKDVPREVIKDLAVQNLNGYFANNYSNYYPNRVNFKNDKIIQYKQLEDQTYIIVKTFWYS